MVDTVHYIKDPFASSRLTFGPGAMQVARCLQAPELSALSPYIGGRARSAEGYRKEFQGEAEERLPLISDAKVRNPTNRCTKSATECKRVQQSAK